MHQVIFRLIRLPSSDSATPIKEKTKPEPTHVAKKTGKTAYVDLLHEAEEVTFPWVGREPIGVVVGKVTLPEMVGPIWIETVFPTGTLKTTINISSASSIRKVNSGALYRS